MDRKTIGRYEILDELGRGAMGSVLRARDPAMGRTVALKCIHSSALAGDQTNEFRERFYREARAAGALAHPGIVPVFDVGEDDGIPFLVMELVQGRTLADAMKTGERYSLERVCEIGQQIAEALGYAHRNGVVHRDIKPANILMTSREVYGAERPRITDFGVAKLAGGEITTTGQLLGTPAFMAPEQFTGAPIDGRADLFSLGVILYRMASGEQPFGGETITAVSYKIVHTDPIPPSRLNPAIGPRLEAVLLKCLAKNPSDRYANGEELAADLGAARSGAQVMSTYTAPAQAGGHDPGATIDVGAMPRTYAGAPPAQWTVPPAARTNAPYAAPPAPPMPRPAERPAQQWTPPPAQTATPAAPPPASIPRNVEPLSVAPPRVTQPAAPSMRTVGPSAQTASVMRSNPSAEPGTLMGRTIRPGAEPVPEKKKKRGIPILVWVIVAVVALVGARYLLTLRVDPTTQQIASDSSQSASSGPVAGATPVTASAPSNFNPKSLDTTHSGRLRLGLDTFPAAVVLTVQMDGQPYWNGPAGQAAGNELVVPAGRHSFQILVYGGASPVTSNIVGGEFAAQRSLLLSAQVRPEPAPGSSALASSSRITLALKTNPYQM